MCVSLLCTSGILFENECQRSLNLNVTAVGDQEKYLETAHRTPDDLDLLCILRLGQQCGQRDLFFFFFLELSRHEDLPAGFWKTANPEKLNFSVALFIYLFPQNDCSGQ